jgi:hypothetical protein
VEEAVAIGNKDLDRLIPARDLTEVTRTCRSDSGLSELMDLFPTRARS